MSVIIPVLNDASCLPTALASIGRDDGVEVIVVNGGENTQDMDALQRGWPWVRWATSRPGRARQMNVGASSATGIWLLFLHADTVLPVGWRQEIGRFTDTPVIGGSFEFRLASDKGWARLIERGVATRVRWFGLPYGDQGLFVRREAFLAIGGYSAMPLMEDVELVRRLSREGSLYHSTLPAVTSARRWETDGWVRRSCANVALVLLFFLGVSPERLARWYRPSGQGRGTSAAAGSAGDAE